MERRFKGDGLFRALQKGGVCSAGKLRSCSIERLEFRYHHFKNSVDCQWVGKTTLGMHGVSGKEGWGARRKG